MRKLVFFFVFAIASNILFAQPDIFQESVPPPVGDSVQPNWLFSVWGDYFIIPNEDNIFNPTFYADHNSFHFEGRYNYEDINTGSAFAGWKFRGGNNFQFVA